ncbi:MAG TPA: outer membrane beta-barrel protein, partial [Patescibacteria group bacterium]|nr:outer membrane beta-barrel protein [Patescibacteria group bacterium]
MKAAASQQSGMRGGIATLRLSVCVVALLAAAAPLAWAQDSSRGDSGQGDSSKTVKNPDAKDTAGDNDTSRMSESYEPKGIEVGNYLLFPQIEAGETFNTNVYDTQSHAKPDFITTVAPEFRAQSRFENHALNFDAQANKVSYATYTGDNHLDGNLAADGRIDVTKTAEITAKLNGYVAHEDRGDPNAVAGALKPTPTHGVSSLVGGKDELGHLTLSTQLGVDRLDFDDVGTNTGTVVDNKARDRTESTLTERAAYEFKPSYSAVLQTSENNRAYDRADITGITRDSQGYRVESGLGIDISQLAKGDLLFGYMDQTYRSSLYSDAGGYSMHATLNWTPTTLTLVVPAFAREVQETTQPGASGVVHTEASMLVRHE